MVAPAKRAYAFFSDNARAFNSKEPEILLAGAAGTGKSLTFLAKILTLCDRYPGCRVLIVRKTRESLTESVLVTWERDVLGPDHPVLTKTPTLRRVRQSYRFANRSTVVVGGMDKPDKVLSSEWDFVYCPEATDLTLVDWETLGGRLRAGVVPFQQLAGDCNPTTPHHFLYKRQAANLCRLYTSRHEDNPRYYDRVRKQWTPAGLAYLARLERMTGARRDRFLKGLWVAAEGVVYDYVAQPPPAGHLLPSAFVAPVEWPRVWGIDWGKTAPTVLLVFAVDPEGRLYHTREVYKTRLRPDVLGRRAREWIESGAEPVPRAIVCDHDEERKADFERASGLTVSLADKADRSKGIEAMQARFDRAADGRARIFFREGAREHPADQFLSDLGKPASCLEELVGYVWDEDFLADEPVADNDHAMDAGRYVCRWVDTHLVGLNDDYTPGADAEPLLPGEYGSIA